MQTLKDELAAVARKAKMVDGFLSILGRFLQALPERSEHKPVEVYKALIGASVSEFKDLYDEVFTENK